MRVLLIFCLLAINSVFSELNTPIVNLTLGLLEGFVDKTINGREFYAFDGIPYAEAPTGENRFNEPKPISPWSNIWVARNIYICMTYTQEAKFWTGNYDVQGDEDCLYLNIYTPTLNESANLDVLVFIHGGAFMYGYGAEIRPNFILDEDLVFVTINYRLGPLGFLSTESDEVPGNNGIKDQILALKFVKSHIKKFGGNPDSVTIDGCSAGGASVHTMYLTEKSAGLFSRGISRSGTLLNPWVFMENSLEKTKKLGDLLGCRLDNITELITCLKSKPARQIVGAVREFQPWLYNPFSPFGLVVDSWASDPIFTEHPYSLLEKGLIRDLPLMISYVGTEGLYPGSDFYFDEYLNDINVKWNEILPHILDFNNTVEPDVLNEVSGKIRDYYLKNVSVTKDNYMDFLQVMSDRIFINGIHKTIYMHVPKVKNDTYLFIFTYQGAHTFYDKYIGLHKEWGAGHYDDVSYIYGVHSMNTTTTQEDRDVIKVFVKFFTSFVKTGKPVVGNIAWPAIDRNLKENDTIIAMKIASAKDLQSVRVINNNAEFWDSLPIMENQKIAHNYNSNDLL